MAWAGVPSTGGAAIPGSTGGTSVVQAAGGTAGAKTDVGSGGQTANRDAGPTPGGADGGQTSRDGAAVGAGRSGQNRGARPARVVAEAAGVGGGSGASGGTSDAAVGGRDAPVDVPGKDVSSSVDGGGEVVTFKNGGFWNDTKGKRIEAHGGGFLKVGDTWYWFGEDKSQNSGTFKAVNCYASKDLVTWEFRNAIITRSTAKELNTSDRIIERPKVVYNASTKQYVMWAHWDNGNYSEASAGVFTSPTVDGNYTFVKSFKPLGNMSRDCNLFVDDDGKGYFMSSANENADMMLYLLTDDYLDVKQLTLKLWAGAKREAPALFKIGSTYFMITSACTGWDPNQAQYATATAMGGPWSSLTNIGDSKTFDTQSTYVIPVVGSEATTYIYAGDRWQDPDLVSSKYIWLPLIVKGTKLGMDFHDQWSLNLSTGKWTAGNSNYVSQDGWKLIKVDSQETEKEKRSRNQRLRWPFVHVLAFQVHWRNGSPATRNPDRPRRDLQPDRHELPDPAGWQRQRGGGAVRILRQRRFRELGHGGQIRHVRQRSHGEVVTFPSKSARYIRFRALSEIQGKQYTAVAELNVVGTPE